MNTRKLSKALEQLALTDQVGKTSSADQSGGTLTITKIGVFGVDAGTLITNPGEKIRPLAASLANDAAAVAVPVHPPLAVSGEHSNRSSARRMNHSRPDNNNRQNATPFWCQSRLSVSYEDLRGADVRVVPTSSRRSSPHLSRSRRVGEQHLGDCSFQ